MSNFTPSVKFSTEFDGDTVTMQLSRMKKKHVMELMPILLRHAGKVTPESNDEIVIDIVDMMKDESDVIDMASKFLPDYVNNFSGLSDANGAAIDLELAMDQNYFQPLISEIIRELINISKPTQKDADKVGKPSTSLSTESQSQKMT